MILIGILEFGTLYFALLYLSDIKVDWSKILLGIYIVPALIGYFISQTIGILIFIFTLICILYYIKKSKWVFVDICLVILMGIFSDNMTQLFKGILNIENNSLILHMILFVCIFVICIKFFKKIVYKKWYLNIGLFNFSLLKYFGIISLVSLMVVGFYVNTFILGKLVFANILIQLWYFILFFLLYIFMIRINKKAYLLQQKEAMQQNFNKYIKDLAEANEEIQKFRHDYLNILLSIRSYVDEDNIDGLRTYFYDHIYPTEQQTLNSNQLLAKLEKIHIIELKSILTTKFIQAERFKIKINLEISDYIKNSTMAPIDLVRILGIYLDNAIEASEGIEYPEINIAFLNVKNTMVIIIENKWFPQQISFDSLITKPNKLKGKNRGRGLVNAREILLKYHNVTYNTRTHNDWFIQEIQIMKEFK